MRLACIGAGPAGLAAAHALGPAVAVTVFEKSRGVSGRTATRWRDVPGPDGTDVRWRYDHGAQYVSPETGSPSAQLLRDVVGDALVEIDGAVWPFDDDGTLCPERARPDPGIRWTTAQGIAEIGRRLRDATPGLDLRLQTRVARLGRQSGGWTVDTTDGERHEGFDAVLLTPPAPQTADLLRASDLGDAAALASALGEADYRSQFTVVWAFDQEIERPADVYALVNAAPGEDGHGGGGHDVAWVAIESDKPGRAPDGASILLAQMSPAWTEAHYDDEREHVVAEAARSVADVWGALPAPLWTDTQRWRYALPNGTADTTTLDAAAGHGLFFAGDFTASKGRVHLAIEEGLDAAERIRQTLSG